MQKIQQKIRDYAGDQVNAAEKIVIETRGWAREQEAAAEAFADTRLEAEALQQAVNDLRVNEPVLPPDETIADIYAKLRKELRLVSAEFQVFGSFEAYLEGSAEAYRRTIRSLLDEGVDPTSQGIRELVIQLQAGRRVPQ